MRLAEWLAPLPLRTAWPERWRGRLWTWMCADAAAGARDGLAPLVGHTRAALAEALSARFAGAAGSPAFCLALVAGALVALAAATGGFAVTRRALQPVPYPDPGRVFLLAQGPPALGVRLGLLEAEAAVLRERSAALEALATYRWYTARFGRRAVPAAAVSADFFAVLGMGPADASRGSERFWVTFDFWRDELNGDPRAVGMSFEIDGVPLRLAGVLPPRFSFLGAGIPVWIRQDGGALPPPRDRWWLGLRGAVARLRPAVTPEAAAGEMRQALVQAGIARNGSRVHLTPVRDVVRRAPETYGSLLLAGLAGALLWAAGGWCRDYRRGYPVRTAARYWGFLMLKLAAGVAAIVLAVFECMGVSRLGPTGGIWWGRELAAMWLVICGIATAAAWAWRDQRGRCRVCFERMREPLRIGVPGQMLLDLAGQEVRCPKGHGTMYTPQSVLGSEMADWWISPAAR
jgi:hypothetical protein